MTIKITSRHLKNIIYHCKKEWPIEACGILAGKIRDIEGDSVKEVSKIYSCRNELNSPMAYRIEAEQQLKIFREIEELRLDLIGFYHSHTSTHHSLSRPSQIDKKRANYYGCSYVIITLYPLNASSWLLEKKGVFKEETISS
ncbi:MAG: M67 family metallopeptidase [Nitrososphaeria archaeon]|jgi:proteasome lid subunit RPN8/RPN11